MAALTAPDIPFQDERETQKVRESLRKLVRQLQTHPIFADGEVRELKNVSLPNAANVVLRHALGRDARRNIIVRATAGAVGPLAYVSSTRDALTVYHAGTPCTADIWVF